MSEDRRVEEALAEFLEWIWSTRCSIETPGQFCENCDPPGQSCKVVLAICLKAKTCATNNGVEGVDVCMAIIAYLKVTA